MNELYPQMRLIDICDQARGIRYGIVKVGNFVSDGIPVIRGGDIKSGKVAYDNNKKVTQEISDQFKRTILHGGEIVINLIGEAGHSAVVPEEYKGFNVTRDVAVIPLEDSVDTRFIDFYLRSAGVIEWMRQRLQGSVTLKINLETLRDVPVYLPPICEQKAITNILGTLDDKIELNRKTNETLEAMAKALFKSWFVDFDPVRAKAEGRPTGLPAEISELFPDSFEDSELGEIPSGWGTTCLDELTSFVIGGDWGKDAWSETEQAKVLCLRGADMPSLQAFAMGKPPTRFLKESSCEKRTLVDGDIVLEISGGSTDQSTGRPVLISSELIKRAETPLTCSNFCRLIRFDDLCWSSYAYYLLLSLYQIGEMFQYETGTTGIKNFGYKYFAGGRFFPKPPSTLLDLFHCQVKSLHSSCHRRGKESDLLSKTRDALLPKLISGEIRIPDAEKMLEEVGV